MQKKFTLLMAFFLIISYHSIGQLASGSITPNFTGTDLDGNEWTLYEILDQGKSVIIDVSATWCGPCWDFHTGGALDELYTQHGPEGTDELMVLFIEGDAATNTDCLYGETDCNNFTFGNWVEGTHYPIIDDAAISELLAVTYFPTLYHVCPNRIINELDQVSASELYEITQTCAPAAGVNNASLLNYSGLEGAFCVSETFTPGILIQNLGLEAMTSVSLDLVINGTVLQTIDWTGSLNTYQIDNVLFDEVVVTEDAVIEIMATSVNGLSDDSPSDNVVAVEAVLSLEISDNALRFELLTDEYGLETYWQILDENENALYAGGNLALIGGADEGILESSTQFNYDVVLPQDGCYEFRIYDLFGDGICCLTGDGFYRMLDADGNVLFEGGAFGNFESVPFNISGSNEIAVNSAIVASTGGIDNFCQNFIYDPQVTIQNLGTEDLTEVSIETLSDGNIIQSSVWTGSISTGDYGFISLDEINIEESGDITHRIGTINGQTDQFSYNNELIQTFNKKYTDEEVLKIELALADFAYEAYWQLADDNGNIIASGGNELVGEAGGIFQDASPADPGVYADYIVVEEEIVIPADAISGCYELLLIDGYGDGFVSLGDDTYFKLTDPSGNVIIYEEFLTTIEFTTRPYSFEIDVLTSNNELAGVGELSVFPNPASDQLLVNFSTVEQMPLTIAVYDVLGRQVATVAQGDFAVGTHTEAINVSDLADGVYFVRLNNDNGQSNRKFIVSH